MQTWPQKKLKTQQKDLLSGQSTCPGQGCPQTGQQLILPTLFSVQLPKEQPKGQEWLERGSDQALC